MPEVAEEAVSFGDLLEESGLRMLSIFCVVVQMTFGLFGGLALPSKFESKVGSSLNKEILRFDFSGWVGIWELRQPWPG